MSPEPEHNFQIYFVTDLEPVWRFSAVHFSAVQ